MGDEGVAVFTSIEDESREFVPFANSCMHFRSFPAKFAPVLERQLSLCPAFQQNARPPPPITS